MGGCIGPPQHDGGTTVVGVVRPKDGSCVWRFCEETVHPLAAAFVEVRSNAAGEDKTEASGFTEPHGQRTLTMECNVALKIGLNCQLPDLIDVGGDLPCESTRSDRERIIRVFI
jgi:hypothetical protein